MQTSPEFKMKIVAGLHKNAELNIQSGICYTVGSGDDCDIILMDNGVDKKHLFFSLFQGTIQIEKITANIYVDGKEIVDTPFFLADFQVVSIGDAHFAMGPSDQVWPAIEPPLIIKDDFHVTCRDLVPVPGNRKKSSYSIKVKVLKRFARPLCQRLSLADGKLVAAVCTFLLSLSIFFFDICQPFSSVEAMVEDYTKRMDITQLKSKSTLISFVEQLSNVGQNTRVGTGLTEPDIPVEVKATQNDNNPIDHLRRALRNTWGQNLAENHVDDKAIYFKGYDDNDAQDLVMEINRSDNGEVYASATTLTKKKKKELLSQIGDTVCLKVNAAEDMENVCKRVLEKKGVRHAQAIYDLNDKSFTLEGRTDDQDTISAVHEIVSKAFPNIKVKNNVKVNAPMAEQLDIRSVSSGGIPHVVSASGVKIFIGGKLENGCTLVDISKNHLRLRCDGSEQMHNL